MTFCFNCDSPAEHYIENHSVSGREFMTPICDCCKSAYEAGQASPDATFISVEEIENELEDGEEIVC